MSRRKRPDCPMILGIDTSCYTTSIAFVDEEGRLLQELRRPLPVAKGERGLRQSEGLFCHVKQLPELLEQAAAGLDLQGRVLRAVAASAKPRPAEGSYMPVFLAGSGLGRSLAASHGAPFFAFSHQEGHLCAALASAGLDWQEPFIALHLSGGTGELLRVEPNQEAGYAVEVIGGCDLPPGQFVDRVGQALGLPFPAGPYLDELAGQARSREFRLSGAVKGTRISFSGPEAAAQRAIAQGVDKAELAAAIFDNIGKSLAKAIAAAREQTGLRQVLLSGGVAASACLRRYLDREQVCFGAPRFSGDNAYGAALLGWRAWRRQQGRA